MDTGHGPQCFRSAGQIYYGDVVEGKDGSCSRHGLGLNLVTAVTVAGDALVWGRYKGAWKQGKMTGTGAYRWSDGSVYEGVFLDGRPHGHGKLLWPEGSFYDGLWAEGEMTGQGSFHNAFTSVTTHGIFHRGCLRQYDGSWRDVCQEREQHRATRLRVGGFGPSPEAIMPVVRCTPAELEAKIASILSETPYSVPLVVADTSCPEAGPDGPSGSLAPLWCLELGERGCSEATTVHLAFATAEQQRQRDFARIFRQGICEALLTLRPFVLVFGEDVEEGARCGPAEGPPPQSWRLDRFLDPLSLPPDLFDLQNFHASGDAERFLALGSTPAAAYAAEKAVTTAAVPAAPAPAASVAPAAAAGGRGSPAPAPSPPPTITPVAVALPPPVVHLLRFALVSLKPLPPGLDDVNVRGRVGRRFAEHLPLHRLAVVVVRSP